MFRSIFMRCEAYRNHEQFLEHTGDNVNLRNIVDQGLKFILFLSPENGIAPKLLWSITSHNLPEHLERAFSLIQHSVFGSAYYQMLQRMQSCIFLYILCQNDMFYGNAHEHYYIFSYISIPFRTCQTTPGLKCFKKAFYLEG